MPPPPGIKWSAPYSNVTLKQSCLIHRPKWILMRPSSLDMFFDKSSLMNPLSSRLKDYINDNNYMIAINFNDLDLTAYLSEPYFLTCKLKHC